MSSNHHQPDSEDWRDRAVTLLTALLKGTWTINAAIAQALGRRENDIAAFLATARPDGQDRVLDTTGGLCRGASFKSTDHHERQEALAVFGIEFDHSGRANAEARLKCADLQALLADPEHGIGPDRTRRTWLDAPGINDTKKHREHLFTLADACTWRGVSETDWSWSGQIERMALPHLPSLLIAAVGFGQGHRIDQMVAGRPDEPGLAVAPQ